MFDTALYFVHYTLLLLFGLVVTAAFSGVRFSLKNCCIVTGLFVFCGLLQLLLYLTFDERFIWMVYPLIAHLPVILLLRLYYRKRFVIALAAVSTAYICCQPSKWFGLLMESLTLSYSIGQITRILLLILVAFIAIRYLAPCISDIYQKKSSSVLIFGMIPMIYYLFDYSMSIYTDFWTTNNRVAIEFLPFILCIAYIIFCIVYFKEYEQKSEAERKEQLIRITVNQQTKEMEAIRRSEHEIRLLRHDMRLLLGSLAVCIEKEDKESALRMISGFSSNVEATTYQRYCKNTTVNYVLSDFHSKCLENGVEFHPTVELGELPVDDLIFSTILSNALDNALNAQKELPQGQRFLKLMLKTADKKLLLSVKNPVLKDPVFVDGLPITNKIGHGYGTQSIRYMTERLGGNCQFTVENHIFILRVVI